MNDIDRDRILRVNTLADSVGLEASLEDQGGAEESFSETGAPSAEASPEPAAQPFLKTDRPVVTHSDTRASHRSSLCNALVELKATLRRQSGRDL